MRIDKQNKIKKASAILTADWHLRDTQPKCRTDNYYETQWKKIEFIRKLQQEHNNCPILVAGDIFDKAEPSLMCVGDAIEYLPPYTICIPGQHDLPKHSLENYNQCGLNILSKATDLETITGIGGCAFLEFDNMFISGFPWGKTLQGIDARSISKYKIALIHMLIQGRIENNQHIPYDAYDINHKEVFNALSGYDLIVSGDNHKPFTCKNKKGQLLVNQGSLMRMTADQIDYKPRVYLWYAKTNSVEPVFLPIEKNVITREYIEKQQEEDERMEKYKARLKAKIDIGMSFKDNMKMYLHKNKIKDDVKKEIYNAMDI